jgi:hypothetical protein
MKHIVCIHPCGSEGPYVGDEQTVTDRQWAELKEQKSGVYPIYALKRDLGTDEVDAPAESPAPVEEAPAAPTAEEAPVEEPTQVSDAPEAEAPVEATAEATPEAPKTRRRSAAAPEEPKAE